MRKVFFENTYTELIDPEDVDFIYEMLSLFFDYNEGRLDTEDDKEIVAHILKELEFIRTIPNQLEEEMEDFEDLSINEFFEEVKSVVEMVMENMIEDKDMDDDDEMGIMDGLSARIALGLGLRYADEIENQNNIIKIRYDEDDEEILISNLVLPDDGSEDDEDYEDDDEEEKEDDKKKR